MLFTAVAVFTLKKKSFKLISKFLFIEFTITPFRLPSGTNSVVSAVYGTCSPQKIISSVPWTVSEAL